MCDPCVADLVSVANHVLQTHQGDTPNTDRMELSGITLLCGTGLYVCHASGRSTSPLVRLPPAIITCLLLAHFPTYFTHVSLRGGFGFIFAWLASFKLLSFVVGRGPLARQPAWPFWKFLVFCLLPVYPDSLSPQQPQTTETWQGLTEGQLTIMKGGAMVALAFSLQTYDGPLWTRHCLWAILVWLLVCLLLDSPRTLATPILGTLRPGMNNPFISGSIRDFWGRRYNLIVSRTLRDAVYQPILDGTLYPPASTEGSGTEERPVSTKPRPGPARKLLAMTAAFAISGFMHQAMLWYMCNEWYLNMLLFFLVQPPLILLEELVFNAAPLKLWTCPTGRVARTCIALGTLLLAGEIFFWPPFDHCGTDKHLPKDIMAAVGFFRHLVGL